MKRKEKRVSESNVEMTCLAVPSDANTIGMVFGGRIIQLMDMVAAIAARRHSNLSVVTVAVDQVRFLQTIRVGHVMTFLASVNRAFQTSMEVGIKVIAEDTHQGKKFHAASAYFTFVGLDEKGKPCLVPDARPQSEDEIRRRQQAEERKKRKNIT